MQTVPKPAVHIRLVTDLDTDFILSLVPRFVAFELPQGRNRRECAAAIRADIARALREAPPDECFFIAEDGERTRIGFLHLQVQRDFFSHTRNCHIADLAVTRGHDGRGIGRALLDHAHKWARKHRCERLTLSVFPGNTRARSLYKRAGFDTDLLRMMKRLG